MDGPVGSVTVPHNAQAEDAVIGAMLLSRHAISQAVDALRAEDFYQPGRAAAFAAIIALHRDGYDAEPIAVADAIAHNGDRPEQVDALEQLQRGAPSAQLSARVVEILVEHAAQRRLISLADEMKQAAAEQQDPWTIIDTLRGDLERVDLPTVTEPTGLWLTGEFAALDVERRPWVVQGLIREQWRAVFVAGEGVGKSLLLAQIAMCAATGFHPLNRNPIRPVERALIVDLENPDDELADRMRATEPGKVWLWHRPEGLNLRTRRGRGEFEKVLSRVRPELVCMGPLYKMFTAEAKETPDLVAGEVQAVLDDLRIRYRFALLLEHHAPHGETSKFREMRPFGSSLWLRWPEFGFALRQSSDGALDVGRFRGDRVKASWPQRLVRDEQGEWWWRGKWNEERKP